MVIANYDNTIICIITLVLFKIPNIISKYFNIKISELLEIIIYLFIYFSEILGEVYNYYLKYYYWDSILHTICGFLCAAIGLSMITLLNKETSIVKYSPIFAAIVSVTFSMTIGVLWEFGEYTADCYLGKDMQKDRLIKKIQSVKINKDNINIPIVIDNISKIKIYTKNKVITVDGGYLDIGLSDTMKDLILNFIGAIAFSVIGYKYINNKDKYHIIELLIPKYR